MTETSSPSIGDQLQGFTFAYGSNQNHLVLPTVHSCPEPIVVSAISPTNHGGPDPAAPYTMIAFVHEQLIDGAGQEYERLYAKSLDLGNLNAATDVNAPWMEGTQFIACVWSSNGVSGGCQDLVTVVSHGNITEEAYAQPTSACRKDDVMASWVMDPSKTLDVEVHGPAGTVAVNAWPRSCTDLQFTPRNGTAPYTLVVASAFQSPINITSSEQDKSMNYTVRLTHGQAFMAGIFDADGNSWAFGPLHAGQSSDISCLSTRLGDQQHDRSISVGTLAGGVVGAFVAGAIGALILAWCLSRRKCRHPRHGTIGLLDPYLDPPPASFTPSSRNSTMYHKPWPSGAYSEFSPRLVIGRSSSLYDPTPSSRPVTYPSSPVTPLREPPTPVEQSPYPLPFEHPISRFPISDDFQAAWRDSGSMHDTSGPDRQRDNVGSAHPRQGSGGPRGRTSRLHTVGEYGPGVRSLSLHDDENEEYDTQSRRARNVYVVHADGGGADLYIRLPQGEANFIELPPTYRPDPRDRSIPACPTQAQLIPHTPPPASPHSIRALPELEPLRAPSTPIELQPIQSRGPGYSEPSPEEIRARAEAALAEKGRPVSGGPPRPRDR